MKKFWSIILLIAVIGVGFYLHKNRAVPTNTPQQGADYGELVKKSGSTPVNAAAVDDSPGSLTNMLEAGINTKQGILSSEKAEQNQIHRYQIKLNGQLLPIKSVSEIELVRAFLISDNQVLLISYNQGGNQCSRQYQVITINSAAYALSNVFGSCLPLTEIVESTDFLIFKMPQNNPYLGKDVVLSYRYNKGKVNLIDKTNPKRIKQKYSGLTASDILKIAQKDGCYVDGIILDDNSCGGGRKYCVMFKSLMAKENSQEYNILSQFCSQPQTE